APPPRRAGAPAAMGGRLVAGMLTPGLGSGRPPAAAPPAPPTARLVRITTPAEIQHQERNLCRSVGAAVAQRLRRRAAPTHGLPAHGAFHPVEAATRRV